MPGKPRVLVVDDDPSVVSLLTDRLEASGFSASSAEDAMQAVIQAEGLKPSLIIMDMNMPGFGTGADAFKALREHPRMQGIPIIVLTGMDLRKVHAMLPPDRLLRVMNKPPDWTLLMRYIQELLGPPQAGKA